MVIHALRETAERDGEGARQTGQTTAMADASDSTMEIQLRLDRLRAGDESARDELFEIACGRLHRLASRMLRAYPAVARWEETDDILQNAAVRLCRALQDVRPDSVRSFLNLAALQIRRELIDLARHYEGPEGPGRHHLSRAPADAAGAAPDPLDTPTDTDDPARLASWTEFHDTVGALPEDERELFHLLWYQGLSQREAAALLGVTERVARHRWRSAQLRLHELLGGRLPG
jgi:RNA polymerase sigma-70 factor (ECF subfamily)